MFKTTDKEGRLHSFNRKPAIIDEEGDKFWYKHGKLHRADDRPATIYSNGNKYWYKNGKQYHPKK